ncbi:MAG: hypothetical protein ABR589_01500 [Chthoniobacterales bacterium]
MTTEQKAVIRELQRLHRAREPLNITAVKRNHPELIERVYQVRPFWGWKRALEDAGLSYADINTELRDYVDCQICGKDMGGLSYHLISQHETTPEEYREEYPEAELMCETVRARISEPRSTQRKYYTLPRWEAIWTPEYVLDRMAELHGRAYPMNSNWASNHEQALMMKAIAFFGSWDEALRRIGLDPQQIRLAKPSEHLSAADVMARLKKRRNAGLALNSAGVFADDSPLASAAQRHFGSHTRALRAAGINPADVVKVKRHATQRITALFAEARRVARLRGDANRKAWLRFKKKYSALAEQKRFGGWTGIAAQAGVPLERLRWERFRHRADVMRALRDRQAQGKSLQAQRILEQDLSLRTAVLKHFGTFEEVYRLFHIQPPGESRWCRVDRAGIVAELQRREKGGEAVSWKKILPEEHGPALLMRAKTLFGSWSAALSAAGMDPFGGARSPWGKARKADVLGEIGRRTRAREPVRFSDVWRENGGQPLARRARQLFGSWNNALRAAGIEPEGGRSPWADASRAAIVAELRRRKRARESLRSTPVPAEKRGRALRDRVRKLFGTWNAALRAAGIRPVREDSPWPRATKSAIIAEIQRRKRAGESLATTKVERTEWGSPLINRAKTLFGSWAAALITARVDLPPGLMSPWAMADKKTILTEVRRRKRARESMYLADIAREPWGTALLKRVWMLFGSWNAALVAAGIERVIRRSTATPSTRRN